MVRVGAAILAPAPTAVNRFAQPPVTAASHSDRSRSLQVFANAGEDVHAVGSLAPIIDGYIGYGYIGCILIRPDGSRILARAVPDPLAQQKPPR